MPAAGASSRSPGLQNAFLGGRGLVAAVAVVGLVVLCYGLPGRDIDRVELFDTSASDNIGRSRFWDTSGEDNVGAVRSLQQGATFDRMSGLIEQRDGDISPLLGAHLPRATIRGRRHPSYGLGSMDYRAAPSARSAQLLGDRAAAATQEMQSSGWESGFPDHGLQDRSIMASRPIVDDDQSRRMANAGFESGFPDITGRVYDRASHQVAHSLLRSSGRARMESLLQVLAGTGSHYDIARRTAHVLGCNSVRIGKGALAEPCASEEKEVLMLKNKRPAYFYKGSSDRGTLASAAATDFSAAQFRATPSQDADAADDAFLGKARAGPRFVAK
mmetsp:Transcript_42894/g.104887  ORF Transcript_42894/g.104887 Transcript_42894/m.104887 type:complete len:330 (-) Transcript_42894:213-1202(-)